MHSFLPTFSPLKSFFHPLDCSTKHLMVAQPYTLWLLNQAPLACSTIDFLTRLKAILDQKDGLLSAVSLLFGEKRRIYFIVLFFGFMHYVQRYAYEQKRENILPCQFRFLPLSLHFSKAFSIAHFGFAEDKKNFIFT